jgi:hypothetical protein
MLDSAGLQGAVGEDEVREWTDTRREMCCSGEKNDVRFKMPAHPHRQGVGPELKHVT